MTRWCVTYELYDVYGNQGIGNDVFSASSIDEALTIINNDLEETAVANPDEITSWRVIGINIMPPYKGV